MSVQTESKINDRGSFLSKLDADFNPLYSKEKTSAEAATFFGKKISTSPSISFFLRKAYNSLSGLAPKAWGFLSSSSDVNFSEIKKARENISKHKALGDHDIAGLYSMKKEALLKNNIFASDALSLLAEGEEKLKALPQVPTKGQEIELKTILQKLDSLQTSSYYHLDDSDSFTERVQGKISDFRSKVSTTHQLTHGDVEKINSDATTWHQALLKEHASTKSHARGRSQSDPGKKTQASTIPVIPKSNSAPNLMTAANAHDEEETASV